MHDEVRAAAVHAVWRVSNQLVGRVIRILAVYVEMRVLPKLQRQHTRDGQSEHGDTMQLTKHAHSAPTLQSGTTREV